LDDAEGVPEGLYERRRIRIADFTAVRPPQDSQVRLTESRIEAYFYLGKTTDCPDCGTKWP
ncbi:MAG: hypothetical protein KDA96_21925, partial [Planctomycetaceae bacterium]|nr:hypothetical protein [Planctomycetaceae bacterium]